MIFISVAEINVIVILTIIWNNIFFVKKLMDRIIAYFFIFLMGIIVFLLRRQLYQFRDFLRDSGYLMALKYTVTGQVEYKDDLLDAVRFANVVAVRRRVEIYQWWENKKYLPRDGNYIYDYEKGWREDFIDSRQFQDISRNNYVGNAYRYRGRQFVMDYLQLGPNLQLAQRYFMSALAYETFSWSTSRQVFKGLSKNKTVVSLPKQEKSFVDLDSYVAANEQRVPIVEYDEFRPGKDNWLYSSNNFAHPVIGDVRIRYEIASPSTVSLLVKQYKDKQVPVENYLAFNMENPHHRGRFLLRHRVYFGVVFFLLLMLMIVVITTTLEIIRGKAREHFCQIIPFFGEYLVYGPLTIWWWTIFLLLVSVAVGVYPLVASLLGVLCLMSTLDYYSV